MKRRTLLAACSTGLFSGCIQFTQGQSNSNGGFTGTTWEFEADAPLTSPVSDGETVYVGSLNQSLFAINRTTGETEWSVSSEQFSSSELTMANPFILEDSIVAQTDQDIVRIDKDSGEVQAAMTGYPGAEFATVSAEMVVGEEVGEGVTAYESIEGPRLWQSGISTGYGHTYSPLIGDDIVLFATVSDYVNSPDADRDKDTRVFALDKDSGQKRWDFTPDDFIGRSAGIAYTLYDDIVVVDNEGKIFGLSGTDGSVLWEDEIERRGSGSSAPQPIPFEGNFWLVSGDIVSFQFETGTTNWTVSPESIHLTSKPPTQESMTWVPTGDFFEPSAITSISQDGTIGDTYDFPQSFEKSPAVDAGSVFISHSDGVLRAYDNLSRYQ
ncbi:hypothetical protein DM826_02085 [Halonotius aquaticus]|uniref:Pyrrolo-quinoline quinone repeat domain-containing protein n=1 Tax=Halonotius aquaticus TaxID=2216978 RepID=A0A3A6PXI6_9EURY|nr:PQQ-binding-like beta-propeller repeat protein [Halonotius aquaticus]RJX44429.1 hypothetical protein DM826_02085 [Halonotius aquaticus]